MPHRHEIGVPAYIGLGSNLDRPIEQLRAGLTALAALPETTLERCSAFYLTAPVGRLDQPDFINAVCRLRTALTPAVLLHSLLDIEAAHGRRRVETGGPRTLDLDLLLYGERSCRMPGLTLPHPRLHERAFVLYPLHELAPDLAIPGRGPLAQLLSACAGQKIEKLTIAP
jgi:2-amino-4-hydroxy-6-hydroxymethyldihydropteridine diphosphokinase